MSKVKMKQRRQTLEPHSFISYVIDFIAELDNSFRTLEE